VFFDDPTADLLARGLLLSSTALVWVVALTRLVGLRSFSKMTSFDFVMTIAMGSLLAGAAQSTDWEGYVQAILAMAGLFAAQWGIARLRRWSERVEDVVQNTPVILMRDGRFDETALARTRTAKRDLIAKLREANVHDPAKVRAVVLETTGDISVLHGDPVDPALFTGVRRPGGAQSGA
jgi:uncharacterized membrane protein YcaP (DUF421 family)